MISRIIFYVVFSIFGLIGGALIYRGVESYNSMNKIDAVIKNKTIIAHSGKRGTTYFLAFETDKLNYSLAFPLTGFTSSSQRVSMINRFETGKLYTFYLNSTYPTSHEINIGVAKVEQQGRVLYQRSEKVNIIIGSMGVVFSLVFLILSPKLTQWKFRNRNGKLVTYI